MTFEETRELLKELREARRYAIQVQRDIQSIRENIDALQSPLGKDPAGGGQAGSVVERIVVRLVAKQEDLARALEAVMDTEDKLEAAIKTLTAREREIIVGYYMRDRTHYQLARECGYEERQVYRIKKQAIWKISKKV